jgi:hypothetical protein
VQKSDHRHRRLLRTCQAFAPPNVQAASAALSAGHDRPPGGSWQVPPRRAATRRGAYAIDLAALAAVIGERVRDKIAASKRKGLWVGGPVPLGYAAVDKKILVVPAEAAAVRTILPVIGSAGNSQQAAAALDRPVSNGIFGTSVPNAALSRLATQPAAGTVRSRRTRSTCKDRPSGASISRFAAAGQPFWVCGRDRCAKGTTAVGTR